MSFLIPRNARKECFYCRTAVAGSSPSSPRFGSFSSASAGPSFSDFRCPNCGCLNSFNNRGEIIGNDPAMWNERLNTVNFSKRGSPDKNQLPSRLQSNDRNVFCRICTTNQTLLINLLANYLPDDENDPTYESRVASLSDYTASLQARYPPVCSSCLPGVEEEIARKDSMARTRALGGALKASRSRAKEKSEASKLASKQFRTMLLWKLRGCLWLTTLMLSISVHVMGTFGFSNPKIQTFAPISPLIVVISLLWTLWDPTYSLRQRSQTRGKEIRVDGRSAYIKLQSIMWISRLIFACYALFSWKYPHKNTMPFDVPLLHRVSLGLEFLVIILSYFSIQIRKPSPIRLIDTSASRALTPFSEFQSGQPGRSSTPGLSSNASSASAGISEPDLFATLSLSADPIIANYAGSAAINPVFGKPSLLMKPSAGIADGGHSYNGAGHHLEDADFRDDDNDDDDDAFVVKDPNAMDWEPMTPQKKRKPQQARSRDDGTWLRQQRFFPPEEPTGLESLLMQTRLVDHDDEIRRQQSRRGGSALASWSWTWVYSLSLIPLLVLLSSLRWRGVL